VTGGASTGDQTRVARTIERNAKQPQPDLLDD
jgi:hypothetical protein